MKYLMFVATVLLVACYGNAADYPLPKGYSESQMCRTDWDCKNGEMCWFAEVQTRPVCMPQKPNYNWGNTR